MVGTDGALSLPWLATALRRALDTQQAHAVLLHGPQGVGQFDLALTLAQAWLCEAADARARPCGTCASCRLAQAQAHPDLHVMLPEALREPLGWGHASSDGEAPGTEKAGKAKPSKEIKVDAVRAAIDFAQTTSARGRGKVVVIHPAERMNGIAANALLKTLEEPAGIARFLLSGAAPDALLPTIRSRCQSFPLALPAHETALAWLADRGVAEAAVLLAATGGQPQEALEWAGQGVTAELWVKLPALVQRGEAAALLDWSVPRLVDALQKLCHDCACVAAGALPRYFPARVVPMVDDAAGLLRWMAELNRIARHAEHPWSAALLCESLVQQGERAMHVGRRDAREGIHEGPLATADSVHSRR